MSAAEKARERFEQAANPAPTPRRWKRCRELVDEILRLASEPEVTLALGGDEVITVRLGAIVLLIGGTGRGKTSLAATFLVEHAQGRGPAISMSLELTGHEWTARGIGTRCDTSWMGVLRGEVPRDRMLEVLPERLVVIEREEATMEALEQSIADLRAEYPDEPILVAVDYAQLIGADSDDEIRPRIGKVMRTLDRVARRERVVVIALSQGSRAASRGLASGEMLGSDTTDTGAESADLERWATSTLAIGKHGEPAADGSCAADLSIGKGRMGGGNTVLPARYYGKSGLWRLTGNARPAAEVKAERQAENRNAKQTTAELAMVQFASKSKEPVSRNTLRAAGGLRGVAGDQAIAALLQRAELVEVHTRIRGMKKGQWPLWTPDKAAVVTPEGDEP